MDGTLGSRGVRWGRAPRGRGRRSDRTILVKSETSASVSEDSSEQVSAEIPVQQPLPIVQQPLPTDRAGFAEMMRDIVRGMAATPPTDSGSIPAAQTDPAPEGPLPIAPTPTAEVRSEGHVDWVKAVGQCRPPFFYGAKDDDIEMWF